MDEISYVVAVEEAVAIVLTVILIRITCLLRKFKGTYPVNQQISDDSIGENSGRYDMIDENAVAANDQLNSMQMSNVVFNYSENERTQSLPGININTANGAEAANTTTTDFENSIMRFDTLPRSASPSENHNQYASSNRKAFPDRKKTPRINNPGYGTHDAVVIRKNSE